MTTVVPLKIVIRNGVNAQQQSAYQYPPFDEIPVVVREGLTWTALIDKYGGWMLDQCSPMGHVDDEVADRDCHIGVVLVPKAFAELAVQRWGDRCAVMKRVDFFDWYDRRIGLMQPDERVDAGVLDAIRARHGISGTIDRAMVKTKAERAALDPRHPAPGVRRNTNKTAHERMKNMGLRLDDDEE